MPRDTWSKWHRIYSVNLILYKSSHLKPLSPLEVLGEFAKNRFGKNFPVAVINDLSESLNAHTKSYGIKNYAGHLIPIVMHNNVHKDNPLYCM